MGNKYVWKLKKIVTSSSIENYDAYRANFYFGDCNVMCLQLVVYSIRISFLQTYSKFDDK